MSDQANQLLSKIPFGLILAAALGYLAYDYYWFTSDAASPLLQKKAQITQTKQEITALQGKIKAAEEFFRTLEARKVQLRELAGRLDEMKGVLTEDLDVPDFIRMAVTEAKMVGINVLSIKPTFTYTAEFYQEQGFDLNFRGIYVQLLVYLNRLSNARRIVRIDNLELNPISHPGSSYVELSGTIQLKAYKYLASKADEVARKGAATGAAPAPASVSGAQKGGT